MRNSFKITVPIMNNTLTSETRERYISLMKEAKVDRVLVAICHFSEAVDYSLLAENIACFEQSGIEVGVWLGETFGHGVPLAYDAAREHDMDFTLLCGVDGKPQGYSVCPLDERFADFFCETVIKTAKAGAKLILFDDDYRLSLRGYGVGCGCELHRGRTAKKIGEPVSGEILAKAVLHGGPNKIRSAWLEAQKESMIEISKKLRAAADSVDPKIRIGLCDNYAVWDTDGADYAELSEILKGEGNLTLARICGAPYWGSRKSPELPGVFEIISLHHLFFDRSEGEYIGEGDTYPRPRQNCPAAYMNVHEAFIRAEGLSGNLKYMCDYTSGPDYETGYLKKHNRELPLLEKFGEFFKDGERCGVRAYEFQRKLENSVLPEDEYDAGEVLSYYPYPHGGQMLAECGIPTVYRGEGITSLAFGENARYIGEEALDKGIILDASAAMILTERGVDVGIKNKKAYKKTSVTQEIFTKQNEKIMITDGEVRILDAELMDGAEIESIGSTSDGKLPLSYRYESRDGKRILVFLFDTLELSRCTTLSFSYSRQKQLADAVEWLSGEALPVIPIKSPFVYTLMKKSKDALTVGLFNCFADELIDPEIEIRYPASEIECLNCKGRLENGKVVFEGDIEPFGYVALKLRK